MKSLVVEDDVSMRVLLQRILATFGHCDLAVNGLEALGRFGVALEGGAPYDLVCLDIMMPEMNGQEALRQMRALEERYGKTSLEGARIVMVTALADYRSVSDAHFGLCTDYLVKPFGKARLLEVLVQHGLITSDQAATAVPAVAP